MHVICLATATIDALDSSSTIAVTRTASGGRLGFILAGLVIPASTAVTRGWTG